MTSMITPRRFCPAEAISFGHYRKGALRSVSVAGLFSIDTRRTANEDDPNRVQANAAIEAGAGMPDLTDLLAVGYDAWAPHYDRFWQHLEVSRKWRRATSTVPFSPLPGAAS